MASLSNLALPTDVDGADSDILGGSRILESGVYPMTLETVYMGVSPGGAISLNISAVTDNGQYLNQTIYLTSGKAKGQKTTYTDKKSGKEKPLPGFLQGNSLAQIVVDKDISTLETTEKVINLYNFDLKKEVPTKVEMLMDLVGKQLQVAVIKQIVDKNVKNNAGDYVPSGNTREENEIAKFFTLDGFTTTELSAKAPKPEFIYSWAEKNDGVTKNKAKGASASGGVTGSPAGTAAAKPSKSLFNK